MNAQRGRPLFILTALLLTGCVATPSLTAVPPTAPPPTASPVPLLPTPTPPPTPTTLTVCMAAEPSSLFVYLDSSQAAINVQSAIFDGPIDTVSYAYRPVILEKIPSLADGDAAIRRTPAGAGSSIADADLSVVELSEDTTEPVRLRPAGCRSDACAVPWLPVSGTVEMDQLVVTFTLRPGVTWADGVPLTAYDSEFAFRALRNEQGITPLCDRTCLLTASYRAVDERTVVWAGLPGFLDSSYMLNFRPPLPRQQLDRGPDLLKVLEETRTPLGYGPFTVEEWVAGDHITVVRNPYYFRAPEGLPRVDRVVFRFVGQDPGASITALLAGDCDILTEDTMVETQFSRLLDLEHLKQLQSVLAFAAIYEHVDFDLKPADPSTRTAFFADPRMREAIALCLDRQEVISKLFFGRSLAPATYVPPTHPLYNPDVKVRTYNPAAAGLLLEEMGWRDVDGDGLREALAVAGVPNWTKLAFRWTSSQGASRSVYMSMFQADLRSCGIDVTLENLPAQDFFATDPPSPLRGRGFDLASFSWLVGVEPSCGLYVTSQIPSAENGWSGTNYSGYSNPAFDAACEGATSALPGEADYERYHKEAQRIFAEDIPSLPLYMELKVAACRLGVTGFDLDPTADSDMWNIEEIGSK